MMRNQSAVSGCHDLSAGVTKFGTPKRSAGLGSPADVFERLDKPTPVMRVTLMNHCNNVFNPRKLEWLQASAHRMGEACQPRPVRKVMGYPTRRGTQSYAKNSFGLRKIRDLLPDRQS